jgi:hypothetical protein
VPAWLLGARRQEAFLMAKKLVLPGLHNVDDAAALPVAEQLELAKSLGAAGLLLAAKKLLLPLLPHVELGPLARRELLANEFSVRGNFLNDFEAFCVDRQQQRRLLDKIGVPETAETRFFGVDVLAWRKSGHRRTLFFFTGSALSSLPRIAMLHQTFKTMNCNLVYVRDHQKLCHMAGLAGMPSVDPSGMTKELRYIHQNLRGTDIVTAGSSVGGYAALRYGLFLGASATLGFSAFTNTVMDKAELQQNPDVKRLYDHNPLQLEDLLPLYAQAPTAPRVTLCYSEDHAVDSRHALHMDSLPGLTLLPVPGLADHDTIKHFQTTGGMRAVMDNFLMSTRTSTA